MKKIILFAAACLAGGFAASSCSDMDEYKKISGDKEILYTGKIEDVFIYTGDGRVLVEGICQSDPKIVTCRIYWDLRKEFVDVPVDMSAAPFTVRKEIDGLSDKVYNFEIVTLDADGNTSVPVYASGRSYGDLYRNSLTNRLVSSSGLNGTTAVIQWRSMDLTLGPLGTQVTYTDRSGTEATVYVPVDESSCELADYYPGTVVTYTTVYRPDDYCLDTFSSPAGELTIQ